MQAMHDDVQCFRWAELLKIGNSQRGTAVFNWAVSLIPGLPGPLSINLVV